MLQNVRRFYEKFQIVLLRISTAFAITCLAVLAAIEVPLEAQHQSYRQLLFVTEASHYGVLGGREERESQVGELVLEIEQVGLQ